MYACLADQIKVEDKGVEDDGKRRSIQTDGK
jgi:hypothetical protein